MAENVNDPANHPLATAVEGIRVEVVEPGSAEDFSKPGGPDTSQTDPQGQTADSAPPAGEGTAASVPVIPAPDGTAAPSVTPTAPVAPVAASAVDPAATPTIGAPVAPDPTVLAALGVAVDTKVAEQVEGVKRTLQGGFDKRAAAFEHQVETAREANAATRAELRELQAAGMTDEQRAQFLQKSAQDDRAEELKEYESDLESHYTVLMIRSLVLDYGEFGVTAEELEAQGSPDEMETYCLQKANGVLRERAENPASATTEVTPAAAPVTPAVPVPAEPQVPAGARAPTDISGGGPGPATKDDAPQSGPGALHSNLKDMKWSDVRIRQS